HLAKTVQSLLLAADLGFDGMLVAARTLIDRTRRDFALASPQLQEASGRINLHATCYALEGLWIWDAHQAVAHDELLETSLCTLASYRLPSGGLPRNAPGGPAREQCDVLSQVIRLAALLGRTELVDGAIARLRDIALSTDHGWAMPYQPEAAETHENAWASMFAAQALTLVD